MYAVYKFTRYSTFGEVHFLLPDIQCNFYIMNNSVEITLNMAILPQAPIAVLSCNSSKEKTVSMLGKVRVSRALLLILKKTN